MRIFFLIFSLVTVSFALNINDSLLKIHATLIPKIYLMDYNVEKKIHNKTMVIAILYGNNTYKSAKSLKEKIATRYPDGINSYKIIAKLVPYSQLSKSKANIFYMLPTSKKMIQQSVRHAQEESALTFAYDKNDLNYGVMISLNVSKKIKPILNLEAIKINNIEMRPILIKISLIYAYSRNSYLDRTQIESLNSLQIYRA